MITISQTQHFHFLVPGINAERGLALAFPANDSYVHMFSLPILQLHENSFFHGLKREWWESSQICPEEQETSKIYNVKVISFQALCTLF